MPTSNTLCTHTFTARTSGVYPTLTYDWAVSLTGWVVRADVVGRLGARRKLPTVDILAPQFSSLLLPQGKSVVLRAAVHKTGVKHMGQLIHLFNKAGL